MNKLAIILLLLVLSFNLIARNADRTSKKVPFNLTVECIREPFFTPIEDSKPEFSWFVPEQSVFQKGYQILVSSSLSNSQKNNGDIWNSSVVKGSKSADVELAGKPLKPNTTYYWKVRIADKKNNFTDYSAVQKFVTGSLKEEKTTSNFFRPEKLKPVFSKKNDDGSFFIDFGKAAFSSLELNYTPIKSEILVIRLGEKLAEGKIDQKPGGTIRYLEVNLNVSPDKSNYKISLVADKRNTNEFAIALPDSFPVLLPFRYAEVVGAGTNFNPGETTQVAYFNYFETNSSAFTSSDTILNRVWDICKYTIKATTFAGLYVDGDRERIPYEADAYLNQLSHYGVDIQRNASGRWSISASRQPGYCCWTRMRWCRMPCGERSRRPLCDRMDQMPT